MSGRWLITDEYEVPDYDEEPIVKDIDGFSDYEIDSFGGVTSYKGEYPIRLRFGRSGPQRRYRHVVLTDDQHRKYTRKLHRLLAEAFVPNPNGYPIVRHLDDNPDNNDISNLAWGTVQDNANDRVLNGRVHTRRVYCYELNTTFNSVNEAAEFIGATPSTVVSVCRGYRHTTAGLHLCYEEDKT